VPVQFSLSIRSERRASVVQLTGELDLASHRKLEDGLAPAVESASELVVLDLGRLEFMDVAGLRALLRAQERAASAGKQLVLAAPAPAVRRLLSLTGQEQAFRRYGSVAEALDPERA
jgi:anti-sigma B factor antagonist